MPTKVISLTTGTPELVADNANAIAFVACEISNMGLISMVAASANGLKVVEEVPTNSPMVFTKNRTSIYVDMPGITAGTKRTIYIKILYQI